MDSQKIIIRQAGNNIWDRTKRNTKRSDTQDTKSAQDKPRVCLKPLQHVCTYEVKARNVHLNA